jgi:hypothetical protein
MAHYKANSTNSRDFSLLNENISIGDLRYTKWYSFKAEISLADHSVYTLEPKGFWDSKIELKKGEETLLYFEMGWKGIVIHFINSDKKYLLRLKGLLSSKYVLVDTDEKELMAVNTDFKWNKLHFDFNIETSKEFEEFDNKELLILTTLHCVNYYISFVNSVV